MLVQNTATILKFLVPNRHSTSFTRVANWVAQFPRSQHSPPSPLEFLDTPLHLSSLLSPLRAREFGVNHNNILNRGIINDVFRNLLKISTWVFFFNNM